MNNIEHESTTSSLKAARTRSTDVGITAGTRAPKRQKDLTFTRCLAIDKSSKGTKIKSFNRREPTAGATIPIALNLRTKIYKKDQSSIPQIPNHSGAGKATRVGDSVRSTTADRSLSNSPSPYCSKRGEKRGEANFSLS
jgi:hypothetical protein